MNIGVIGAGSWGTALACVLAGNHHSVKIWAHDAHTVDEINSRHTNSVFLPGITLDEKISATGRGEDFADAEILVLAVPTQYVRSALTDNHFDLHSKILVNVAKGIEKKSLLRISELIHEISGEEHEQYVNLTGPSHAEEVSRMVPTTVVAASGDRNLAEQVQKVFSTSRFRVYSSDDLTGTEIAGALKNVIAISAGIIDGLELGDNAKAALMTRGLAEIARLGRKLGARPETFSGLAGMGDLIVTCASRHSRNRHVGEAIGRGKSLQDILAETQMVAEGVSTTESAYQLSLKIGVEMPITEQVYKILFEGKKPLDAIHDLMCRESKAEHWW